MCWYLPKGSAPPCQKQACKALHYCKNHVILSKLHSAENLGWDLDQTKKELKCHCRKAFAACSNLLLAAFPAGTRALAPDGVLLQFSGWLWLWEQILWVVCLCWVKKSPSVPVWLAMKPVGSARQALTRRVYGHQHLRSCSLGGCERVFRMERVCGTSPAWEAVTGQQLQLCEGGGMPGVLWPDQSWGFSWFQPCQPKTVLPDSAGRENRAQRACRDTCVTAFRGWCSRWPAWSRWNTSLWVKEQLLLRLLAGWGCASTGQSKTVLRRLKWL